MHNHSTSLPGKAAASSFEDATYSKVTWRLIPFLFLCYVVAYLDRVNVGFAKLQMLTDLKFSETAYGFGAGIFFLGYFLFDVPGNVFLHRVGARVWIARIMITWGVISGAMMLGATPMQFYVLRFFLGVAEAGFFPGIILYLTYWYPSQRRGKMVALFMTANPVSGVNGGPLTAFLGGTAAAAGIALINSVDNLAGFVSPYLIGWIKDVTRSTDIGVYVLAVSLIAAAVFTLVVPKRLISRQHGALPSAPVQAH